MNSEILTNIIRRRPVILDGAVGTIMHERGMPSGVCPEVYAIEHSDILMAIQRDYYESGADIIYTFTLGANSIKLAHYGIAGEEVRGINKELARISCEVRDEFRDKYPERDFYVAGDMAPTGSFLEPAGDMSFDNLVEIYSEAALGLLEGGVDMFVVETMMDLAQTRAAVLAIKDISNLPVLVTLTFSGSRTLSGNTPESGLVTLQSLGVDAFGANCSTGPKEMIDVLYGLRKMTDLPLIAKPNAGLPVRIDGKTVFPMGPQEFGEITAGFYTKGINVLGGCCGTTPLHIAELRKNISGDTHPEAQIITEDNNADNFICSGSVCTRIGASSLFEYVVCTDINDSVDIIADSGENSPDCIILDFTEVEKTPGFSVESLNEVLPLATFTNTIPLGIKTRSSSLLEIFAKLYCGRLLYFHESATGEISTENLIIIQKYGMFVKRD